VSNGSGPVLTVLLPWAAASSLVISMPFPALRDLAWQAGHCMAPQPFRILRFQELRAIYTGLTGIMLLGRGWASAVAYRQDGPRRDR